MHVQRVYILLTVREKYTNITTPILRDNKVPFTVVSDKKLPHTREQPSKSQNKNFNVSIG